jgi:hypothetical protein
VREDETIEPGNVDIHRSTIKFPLLTGYPHQLQQCVGSNAWLSPDQPYIVLASRERYVYLLTEAGAGWTHLPV